MNTPHASYPQMPELLRCFSWDGLSKEWPTKVLRHQMIVKSRQPHIQATVNDSSGRFRNKNTFNNWAQAGKTIFALTDTGYDLAGVIWFGKKDHPQAPDHDTTFAIRLYEVYVGRGIAKPFMAYAHEHVQEYMPDIRGVWLETDSSNESALRLYQSFGYIAVENSPERVLMTYDMK